jgi:hypothetical protein
MLLRCNSNNFVNEIHSICPKRERDNPVDQETRHPTNKNPSREDRNLERGQRTNETLVGLVKSQRSDPQTLTIPTGDHKEQERQLRPSYDRLWTSTKPQETKSTCREFAGTCEGETRTNQGQNPTNWNDMERLSTRRQDDQDPKERSS